MNKINLPYFYERDMDLRGVSKIEYLELLDILKELRFSKEYRDRVSPKNSCKMIALWREYRKKNKYFLKFDIKKYYLNIEKNQIIKVLKDLYAYKI